MAVSPRKTLCPCRSALRTDGLPRGERNGTLTEIFASKANTVAAAPLREYVYGLGLGASTSTSVFAAPPRRTHPRRRGGAGSPPTLLRHSGRELRASSGLAPRAWFPGLLGDCLSCPDLFMLLRLVHWSHGRCGGSTGVASSRNGESSRRALPISRFGRVGCVVSLGKGAIAACDTLA